MPTNLPLAPSSGAPKSCGTCPALMQVGAQQRNLGASIGAPVCGIKLIPLSRPGANNTEKMFEHFASDCASHGKEVTFTDDVRRNLTPIHMTVAFPENVPSTASNRAKTVIVDSCVSCKNYVPPPIAKLATGYNGGFCRAKGSILFQDRLQKYANGCESAEYQASKDRLNAGLASMESKKLNTSYYPEYDLWFGRRRPIDINKIHQLNLRIRPSEWETERTVTPAHRAAGIRAFRKLEDPRNYGPAIVLPIMDENAIVNGRPLFSEEDKVRIPRSGDPEKPESYFDHNGAVYDTAVMWTKLKQTPALWGPAGVGKTELFRHMAWMMGMPFQRLSFTEATEIDDIIGKVLYTPEKGTYFQYGRLIQSMTRPNVLCLDEPNASSPAVWQTIRPITDDSKQVIVYQNKSERIPIHKLCYMGFAMNPAWDPRNTGVMPLADADGSRLMHIEMDLPPESIEKKILLESMADQGWELKEAEDNVNTLMNIAKELRDLSENGSVPFTWGIRNQKKVLAMRRYATWKNAFRLGVTNALEPIVRETILRVVSSNVNDED